MAHIRKNCKNVSTTVSLEEALLQLVDDYRFSNRKDNRSVAFADLLKKGLKYEQLLQKKRDKDRSSNPA